MLKHFIEVLRRVRTDRLFCVLLSCVFFVSCNTVHHRTYQNRGVANIGNAAISKIHSSAFLAMQACPVISGVQSAIQSGTSVQRLVELMEKKDHRGRTLSRRLMSELSSSPQCSRRLTQLKQGLCSRRAYDELCQSLVELERMGYEGVIEEFELFLGASVESFSSQELAVKLQEFITSDSSGSKTLSLLRKIKSKANAAPLASSFAAATGLLLIPVAAVAAPMAVGVGAVVVMLTAAWYESW